MPAQQRGHNPGTTNLSTGFTHLPQHLQTRIFALSGAPLHTCTTSASIRADPQLYQDWVHVRKRWPQILLKAAREGKVTAVRVLLEAGMSKAGREAALLAAAYRGHTEVVHLLLKYGVGADIASGEALRAAALLHSSDVARLLIQSGAAIRATFKWALVWCAVWCVDLRLLRLVLKHGFFNKKGQPHIGA